MSAAFDLLVKFAGWFWPGLNELSRPRRYVAVADVITFWFNLPLALIGLAWLWMATDWEVWGRHFIALLFFGALLSAFNMVRYFLIIEIRNDRYGSADGSLGGVVQWAALLLFGTAAIWLSAAWSLGYGLINLRQARSAAVRWNLARSMAMELAGNTIGYLIALMVYTGLGGQIPIASLNPGDIFPALAAILVSFIVLLLIWSEYVVLAVWIQRLVGGEASSETIIRFVFLALGLAVLANPFGLLGAGLYVEHGVLVYLFLMTGLLLVAILARRLSWAAESSRLQSRQLERLETLSRDLLSSPLDGSAIGEILTRHVTPMFPSGRAAIWLSPGELLFKNPPEWEVDLQPVWSWMSGRSEPACFTTAETLPWANAPRDHNPLVIAPVIGVEGGVSIGLVYFELRSLAQPWDQRSLQGLFPAASSLAAQVASALHRAAIYQETLHYQKAVQELEFAGKIQASFLPREIPRLYGWELAVTLQPARHTSGDFFDFIPLSQGRIGLLIADVADKGVGAALYMALSRTLLRTYALEYEEQPDLVFFSSNERILNDASANLFVTAFYAILDQTSGMLIYANAGHNPPYLFSPANGGAVRALKPTGMPIGVDEEAVWTQGVVHIDPGDVLVLYTDGIPDAQNAAGDFFKESRLVEVVKGSVSAPAQEIQTSILEAVKAFVAGAPQFDDITLLLLARDANPQPGQPAPANETRQPEGA
jgi:serine phosphatase RsbU (regulator of sigma subunit)